MLISIECNYNKSEMIVELLSNPVLTILCFVIIPFLTSMINSTSYADSFGNSMKCSSLRINKNNVHFVFQEKILFKCVT